VFYPSEKRQAKRRVGAPLGVPLMVMLANLAPHKGQETTIHTMALLKRRGINIMCWLAGNEREGSRTYTDQLCRRVNDLGLNDRVRFIGYRGDAPDLLRAADFFLLPSSREGLPLSILEAQATSIPVLAAPTPGICEVIRDCETGFLITNDNPVGYADCVEALLRNPDLNHRVTENAYKEITNEYDWTTFCERIWHLYSEL
jgi:glycosyltransferase involved in cell wall biosynthesis